MLDGLRGIAAICVTMMHFNAILGQVGMFARSYLAVDFFFMLSGFVLIGTIENDRPVRTIMLARLARFWPLMAVGTLIGLAGHAAVWGPGTAALFVVPALLLVPMLIGAEVVFPLNSPQWSLLDELIANFVHALLLRRMPIPGLLAISALAWCGLQVLKDPAAGLDLGSSGHDFHAGLLRAAYAYPLGCALGRLVRGGHDALRAAQRLPWWLAPVLLVGVLVAPQMLALPRTISDLLVLLAFVPVLLVGAAARPTSEALPRLAWLGAISFPLYAIHFPLIEGGRLIAERVPAPWHALPSMVALALSFWWAHLLAGSWLARGIPLRRRRAAAHPPATEAGLSR